MKRGLLVTLVVLSALVGAGGLLFAFGTPQAPAPSPLVAGAADPAAPEPGAPVGSGGDPGAGAPAGMPPQGGMGGAGVPAMGGGDPSARGKEAPPADPNSPLAIQIPGCVCHSDDPRLVEEHAQYRMNQCFGCHSGGGPGGGQGGS